jgi:hypothetical protein
MRAEYGSGNERTHNMETGQDKPYECMDTPTEENVSLKKNIFVTVYKKRIELKL